VPLIANPSFATATDKVPPAVKPLMGSVYGLLPASAPLVILLSTADAPMYKWMSLELRPDIGTLKDKVKSVVVCVEEPLAVTLENVTAIVVVVTVTAQVAVLFPSAVVTVMVPLPAATAVTVPFDTVAILLLLEVHVTFLFVALAGATVAVNVSVLPTRIVVDVLLSVTPVTEMGETVTAQVAVLFPS
jgi:hypothetical protein